MVGFLPEIIYSCLFASYNFCIRAPIEALPEVLETSRCRVLLYSCVIVVSMYYHFNHAIVVVTYHFMCPLVVVAD
jgi:hypothetical protein